MSAIASLYSCAAQRSIDYPRSETRSEPQSDVATIPHSSEYTRLKNSKKSVFITEHGFHKNFDFIQNKK